MNDNKSTVMNNAAVQQLRKVPGFDPMKLLRKTISVKTGHPVWKLDLRYKRLWFRLACPNGRMLLKPLRISDQLAIIEAQVYFSKDDPVPAASFTSEQRRENVPGGEFLRAAQEDALNMALENAGFGIQFCDVSRDYGGELCGSEVPIQTEAAEADEEAAEAHKESASSSFIVKNALTYIEENYTKKLTLCEVAEKTYVSQWHLSKLLNRHTGQSFSDILNHVRIEHAKELLKDPSLRIGDISEQVGFLDLAHFSRVFKKQEGVSANEYRNQVLGK